MKNVTCLLLVSIVFVGCSSVKVFSDMDSSVNFTQYNSLEYYGWLKNSDQILSRFDKERIEKAFAHEFKTRGINAVEENGDLVVALFIITEDKTSATATTNNYGGYGYGGYYGYGPGWGWGVGHSTTTYHEYDYTVGTIVVSVFDKKEEKLVWEGIGSKEVSEDPKKRERTIPYAVKQIMAQYPIKPIPTKK